MTTFTKTYYAVRKNNLFLQKFGYGEDQIRFFFGSTDDWKLFSNRQTALDLLKNPGCYGCCVIPVKVTFEY